ncbi:MAG: PD-(D/E)XK nuclease family protein, partial [Solirubrobacterales bacterium]|nr:PD-(D/E)XK nuclease family protein [Solirubrobacterales bacterium]
ESGGIVHEALERLFRDQPGGERRPREESCERWVARAAELIREIAAERGWDPESASARISLARLDAVVERLLRREAEFGGPLLPDPDLLEARFGDRPEDSFAPADFGGFRLHGAIDRIDVDGGRALIRDYKLSTKAVAGAKLSDEGRLQLPLYMIAARGFGLEPIGGLYSPLAATKDDRPRGLLSKEHKGALIPGETGAHFRSDFFDPEELEAALDGAVATATGVVEDIRAGRIARNPRDGKCPSWCMLAPVCRVERGIPAPDDEEDEEEMI